MFYLKYLLFKEGHEKLWVKSKFIFSANQRTKIIYNNELFYLFNSLFLNFQIYGFSRFELCELELRKWVVQ